MIRYRFLFPLTLFSIVCIVLQPLDAFAIDGTYDLRIGPITNRGAEWGTTVAAGDFNNDGYDDLIFGDGYNRIYVHWGSLSGLTATNSGTILGPTASSTFGYDVATGDVNNDGYDDMIVGAPNYSTNTGRSYVFLGGSSLDTTADVIMTGGATENYFGTSVATCDVNSDGYDDVIVGANGYSTNTGRSYVFLGGASMDNTADVTMTGGATNNDFGISVACAGDVDNNGYQDVIIGAVAYSTSTGRSYVFLGGASMDNTADVTMTGEATSDEFGVSVSPAGDVDNDGYDDVIVGARSYSSSKGRAYIFLGGSSMNSTADVTMTGPANSTRLGSSVNTIGDLDGDGYDDVIVGAAWYSAGSEQGRAYLFNGGSSMDNTADQTFTGESAGDQFASVYKPFTVGNFNNDSVVDLVIGARGAAGGNYDGAVYVYLAVDTTAPVISTLSPADNATGVSPTANLVLTFNEVVRAGTGSLTIKKSSDSSTVETITVSGALLSGNGSTQLTLNPSTTLCRAGSAKSIIAGATRDTFAATSPAPAESQRTTESAIAATWESMNQ